MAKATRSSRPRRSRRGCGSASEPTEQFGLLRGHLPVEDDAAFMQPGQRLDGRDDGRGVPGCAGSRLGCLRLRCELRCRFGLVLRLVVRGGCRGRSFGHPVRTDLRQARYVEGAELAGKGHRAVCAAWLLLLHATAALLLLLHATAALLLLLHATDMVVACVKNLCDTVDLDREPPGTREDCVAHSVL